VEDMAIFQTEKTTETSRKTKPAKRTPTKTEREGKNRGGNSRYGEGAEADKRTNKGGRGGEKGFSLGTDLPLRCNHVDTGDERRGEAQEVHSGRIAGRGGNLEKKW